MKGLLLIRHIVVLSAVLAAAGLAAVNAQEQRQQLSPATVTAALKEGLGFSRVDTAGGTIYTSRPEPPAAGGNLETVKVVIFHNEEAGRKSFEKDSSTILAGGNPVLESGGMIPIGTAAQKAIIARHAPWNGNEIIFTGSGRYVSGGATVEMLCGFATISVSFSQLSTFQAGDLSPEAGAAETRRLSVGSEEKAVIFAKKVYGVFLQRGLCGPVVKTSFAQVWDPETNYPWCKDTFSRIRIDSVPKGHSTKEALAYVEKEDGDVEEMYPVEVEVDRIPGRATVRIPDEEGWRASVEFPGVTFRLNHATWFKFPCREASSAEKRAVEIELAGGTMNFIWNKLTGNEHPDFKVKTPDATGGFKDYVNYEDLPKSELLPQHEPRNRATRPAFLQNAAFETGRDQFRIYSESTPDPDPRATAQFTVDVRNGRTKFTVYSGVMEVTPEYPLLKPFVLKAGQQADVSPAGVSAITTLKNVPAPPSSGVTKNTLGKTPAAKVIPAKPVPVINGCKIPDKISAWRAENSGNDENDRNGGTLIGYGADYAPGRSGRAFSFNGVDSYLAIIQSDTSLNLQKEVTLSAWIFVPTTNNKPFRQAVMGKFWDEDKLRGYELNVFNKKLELLAVSQGETEQCSPISTTDLVYGQWNHVAGTVSSKACSVYINGRLAGSGSGLSSIQSNASTPFNIGVQGMGKSNFFQGLIDEAAVYSRALPASEIEAIFATGGNCPSK